MWETTSENTVVSRTEIAMEVNKDLLKENFQCPICLDFLVNPVYSCSNGHFVCGSCYIGLNAAKKCQLCQLKLSRNKALDRILEGGWVKISCRNADDGCGFKLSPGQMKDHLTECDFRGIICYCGGNIQCDRRTYSPGELVKHWKTTHKISKLEGQTLEENRFTIFYELDGKDIQTNESLTERPTCTKYFEFDGQTFFIHIQYSKKVVFQWITCAATETEIRDKNYEFISSFLKGQKESKLQQNKDVITAIPVRSLHCSDLGTVIKSGHKVVGDDLSTILQILKDTNNFVFRFDLLMTSELTAKKMKLGPT